MTKSNTSKQSTKKQRLTAFVDPILVKRAKVRGALEGLTISEMVEKALDEYAPIIENDSNQLIRLNFSKNLKSNTAGEASGIVTKRTKALVVPR